MASTEVCVIAPRLHPDGLGQASALVPLERPTIFAMGRFEEVRIERQGRLIWRRQASEEGPIEGPIPWPLAPIRPGETLLLRLRPQGAAAEDFAAIGLTGAPAGVMASAEALRRSLRRDPSAWQQAVQRELDRPDLPLAWALLFAFEGPSAPELDALRREVYRRGCGSGDPSP
jgi:hypothetical protein